VVTPAARSRSIRLVKSGTVDHMQLAQQLAAGGCVAPEEDAAELVRAAADGSRPLEELVARRLSGEPLAWITGFVHFCGLRVHVDPGVYVPRPQTQALARRAASLLPPGGTGVDLCTGSGAVAAVLGAVGRGATVLATDVDPAAVACARRNGVRALLGSLDEALPESVRGRVDIMTAVVPYVPAEELHLLPRDVLAHEPRHALDGGPGGTTFLRQVAMLSADWLAPGGRVLLELGGDQAGAVAGTMELAGLSDIRVYRDPDGDDRAIEGRRTDPRVKPRPSWSPEHASVNSERSGSTVRTSVPEEVFGRPWQGI
jgi:release factor glutamine methyltransferase